MYLYTEISPATLVHKYLPNQNNKKMKKFNYSEKPCMKVTHWTIVITMAANYAITSQVAHTP